MKSLLISVLTIILADAGTTGFFTGKVDEVDAEMRTLSVKSEKSTMTFVVAPDAKIIGRDLRELSLSDLEVGSEVTVDYSAEDDLLVAHTITVKPFEPPAPPGEPSLPL